MKKVTTQNSSVANKWGKLVASYGHTAIPNLLIEHVVNLKLSPSEFLIVVCVLKFKWSDEDPYPSADTLSKLSGLAKNTVRTQIRQLKKRGIVKVVRRTSENNAQQSNGYDFTPLRKRLESYAQRTPKRASTRLSADSQPYSPTETKEDAANKTQEKRRSTSSGKPTLARNVLMSRYPGIANKS